MGVAIAALAIGGLAAGGISAHGANQQASAQYLANKVEVERNNFQQSLANDRANFVSARRNALQKWNNQKIAQAAVQQYSDAKRYSRKLFQANAAALANQQISFMSRLETEATGKNIRGGMVERMKTVARNRAKDARLSNRNAQFERDLQAAVSYENMLNQRDMLSYETANIQIPGSTGIKPGGGQMNMLAGMLGGTAGGLSAGVGVATGLKNLSG